MIRCVIRTPSLPFCEAGKRTSSAICSPTVIRTNPPDAFVNAAARFECALTPRRLLNALQAIEWRHGRIRGVPNGPRTLDLDLLLYGQGALSAPGLELPHPRLNERLFVVEPLAELAPRLPLAGGVTAATRARALAPASALA